MSADWSSNRSAGLPLPRIFLTSRSLPFLQRKCWKPFSQACFHFKYNFYLNGPFLSFPLCFEAWSLIWSQMVLLQTAAIWQSEQAEPKLVSRVKPTNGWGGGCIICLSSSICHCRKHLLVCLSFNRWYIFPRVSTEPPVCYVRHYLTAFFFDEA